MAGIINDTSNIGANGSNILDIAALGLVFGDGFGRGHGGHHYEKSNCCPPATCEQVNDVDRDVIRCANDVDRDVLTSGFDIRKDVWDTDRDVLLSNRDIKEEICKVQHHLEKDIWGVDKDVLIGFKDTDHKIDMVKCEVKEGFAEIKGTIEKTALYQELREKDTENRHLARCLDEAKEKNLKKDIVSELLAAMGAMPVIANS